MMNEHSPNIELFKETPEKRLVTRAILVGESQVKNKRIVKNRIGNPWLMAVNISNHDGSHAGFLDQPDCFHAPPLGTAGLKPVHCNNYCFGSVLVKLARSDKCKWPL